MLRVSNWIFVLSLVIVSGEESRRECERAWILNEQNDKCYFFSTERLVDFDRAKFFCAEFDSFMAMPKTEAERTFISDQLIQIKRSDNEIETNRDKYTAWLGGKKSTTENRTIEWFDGSKTKATFRSRLKPCKETQYRCCAPSVDIYGRFTDSWCERTFAPVCQKESIKVIASESATSGSEKIDVLWLTLCFAFLCTLKTRFAAAQ